MTGAILARAEAQVMRLACVYALLDRSCLVELEHLEAALALWDYSERSAEYVFGDSLGNPVADEILRALRGTRRDDPHRPAGTFQREPPRQRD